MVVRVHQKVSKAAHGALSSKRVWGLKPDMGTRPKIATATNRWFRAALSGLLTLCAWSLATGGQTASVMAAERSNSSTPVQSAPARSSKVTYAITFAGVRLGTFRFAATNERGRYRVKGKAKISALFGAVKYNAHMSASGSTTTGRPVPNHYVQSVTSKRNLVFKTKKKTKRVDIRYSGGDVKSTKRSHRLKTRGRAAFLDEHFRDVLDPAAAVLAMTFADGKRPCQQRLPVYNGRQRFDLVLTLKRRITLKGARLKRSGNRGVVCGVRYIPIAGHRLNDKERADLENRRDIEIVMQRAAGTASYVPLEVRVPTRAGVGLMRAEEVALETQAAVRIALIR